MAYDVRNKKLSQVNHGASNVAGSILGGTLKRTVLKDIRGCRRVTAMTTAQLCNSLIFPRRHVSFLGLSVGFLLIWTVVLSGLLLNRTFEEDETLSETVRIFNAHQDLGRIIFSVGHEMVSTVDLLLTESPESNRTRDFDNRLSITWKMTDAVFDVVEARTPCASWMPGTSVVLEDMKERLREFRELNLRKKLGPLEAIALYSTMCDRVERDFRALTTFPLPGSGAMANYPFLPFAASSYPLFNQGMATRFAEIALGTYYFRAIDGPMNATQYFHLHHSSKTLILAAFKYNPRIHLRYFQAQIMDAQVDEALALVGQDILNNGANRSSNAHAAQYLDGVKEEIATLLLAKDFLNTTIANEIAQLSRGNLSELNFHLAVSSVALSAIFITAILLFCSFRYVSSGKDLAASEKAPMTTTPLATVEALVASNERAATAAMAMVGSPPMEPAHQLRSTFSAPGDRLHFLPANFYTKPRCYL